MIKRYRIMGRVQGVGYRAFVLRKARELGLNGWVRNRGDGTVEALVDASQAHHATLENLLRDGPRYADVRMVLVVDEIEQSPLTGGFTVTFEGG
jgi:acylphosphatase